MVTKIGEIIVEENRGRKEYEFIPHIWNGGEHKEEEAEKEEKYKYTHILMDMFQVKSF